MGPCEPWIDAADVAACCGDAISTENEGSYEDAAELGTQLAWIASGRRFHGICGPVTVRPKVKDDACWGSVQWLSYPDGSARPLWTGLEWSVGGAPHCGCGSVSQVRLSGYVQEIEEVTIDGVALDPADYRVDKRRWLVRTNNGRWPCCQNHSLEPDQPGTFAVSYTYGKQPDELALEAARVMACEFYRACNGGECQLPQGAVKIIRQGVTIERLQPLASMLRRGETGILGWDAFIDAYGGYGKKPTFYAPGGHAHAQRQG